MYRTSDISTTGGNGAWAAYSFDKPGETSLARYLASGEYWIGLSYGAAGAFAAFCLFGALKKQRETNLAASAGGIALSGLLWAGVCFFTGCCGSPMLPVYLGLLGPKFIGVTRPVTFALTILSIMIGAWIMSKKSNPDNVGMMGDVMMKMEKKLSAGHMSSEDTQKMCGMLRNMAKMMHEMKSGCTCATLKTHQTKMDTYESELEKMGSEFYDRQ